MEMITVQLASSLQFHWFGLAKQVNLLRYIYHTSQTCHQLDSKTALYIEHSLFVNRGNTMIRVFQITCDVFRIDSIYRRT